MTKSIDLFEAAKAAAGCQSDYAFSQKLGISRQAVSKWRKGGTFDDAHAAVIAELLGKEPGEVMALCQAERAKDEPSRSRWMRVAAMLATAATLPVEWRRGSLTNPLSFLLPA